VGRTGGEKSARSGLLGQNRGARCLPLWEWRSQSRAPELEAVLVTVKTMLEAKVVQTESLRRAWG
jgi:hypothetical protein